MYTCPIRTGTFPFIVLANAADKINFLFVHIIKQIFSNCLMKPFRFENDYRLFKILLKE